MGISRVFGIISLLGILSNLKLGILANLKLGILCNLKLGILTNLIARSCIRSFTVFTHIHTNIYIYREREREISPRHRLQSVSNSPLVTIIYVMYKYYTSIMNQKLQTTIYASPLPSLTIHLLCKMGIDV